MHKKNKLKAFTILELLLVIAVLGLMATMIMPVSYVNTQDQQLRSVVQDVLNTLFISQQNAYSRKNNKNYGVYIQNDKFTEYTGNSFATAEDYLEHTFPVYIDIQNINLTGGSTEVKFNQGLLSPDVSGTFEITNGNKTFQISISPIGVFNRTIL